MMIDEVNASKKSYIRDTPQYVQWGFLGQQDKRFMNRKSDGGHPFSQQPSQTYYEDPLIVGSKEHHKGSFLQYNNRAIESSTKHLSGGAMMYQQPQDSDSSDYSSSSDEEEGGALMYQQPKADKYKGGDLSQLSKEELMEMIQGGGIYDDYIKPAGKFLGKIGSEVVNEIIVPVGKELVKDAVRGAVTGAVVGAGKRGRPKGSKNKKGGMESDTVKIKRRPREEAKEEAKDEGLEEFEEIVFQPSESDPAYLRKMDKAHRGEVAHLKDEIAKLLSEKSRVEGEKKFEEGMIKEAPKKARKPRKKVLKNIEDELRRVEGETKKERAMEAVAKLVESSPPKAKVKRGLTDKAKERVEIVKQVMKEKGLKLGPASKYVKEHNLWQPAKGEWF
jgi:hypothetical protein